MTQSEVRQMFVKANPGVRLPGYNGYWYRCAKCGKWCGRPGRERANIPEDCKMEVDHRLPKRKGGTDDLWNLQSLCKPCNRGKSANQTSFETADTVIRATMNGDLHKVVGGVLLQKAKDALGIKYKRS